MTFNDLDQAAQRLPGQTSFDVTDSDYAALLALNNPSATKDLGAYFIYTASMGPGNGRPVRVVNGVISVDSGTIIGA